MKITSVWETTRTFFPLFLSEIKKKGAKSIAVVGASDGKFVLPLAEAGIHVVAIENNPIAVNGGTYVSHDLGELKLAGLRNRLKSENLLDMVEILEYDLLKLATATIDVDAVWTSCSWHYSINHHMPVGTFISQMCGLLCPGGLFGAEYMMPVAPIHFNGGHYMQLGELATYFDRDNIIWDLSTQPFIEDSHVDQPQKHIHQMGFLVATL